MCHVLARGVTYASNNSQTSRGIVLQILYHVCECLMDLHKEGYVHRDLKPANIMWLPSQNRWTIIDFGCVAKIEKEARMGFSLMYAAPEVVTAVFKEHRSTMRATTAIDAWSVGILAVELFTAKPALRLIEGREKVCGVVALCHIFTADLQIVPLICRCCT